MGDYTYGLNTNGRSLSPVDYAQLVSNPSLFTPESVPSMQDETLQTLSPNGEHIDPNEDPLMRKMRSDVSNGIHDEKKNYNNNVNDPVNSVANSLNQLALSEPNSSVHSAAISSAPSFWSTANCG